MYFYKELRLPFSIILQKKIPDKLSHPVFGVGFSATRTIWVSCSAYAEASADTVVTIFAPHLDNFIVKQKSRPFTSTVIPALDRSVLKRQFKPSPGLAKIAPYLPCHRDSFSAKIPGSVAGWLRQVTLTAHTRWPLYARRRNARPVII